MSQARRAGKVRGDAPVGRIELVNLGDRERPELEGTLIDPKGGRTPLDVGKSETFPLEEKLRGQGYRLEIGAGGDTRRYRYDFVLDTIAKEGVLRFPEPAWVNWFPFSTCV